MRSAEEPASGVSIASASPARIVLASASPRRLDLLKSMGLEFEVLPSDIDEQINSTDPVEVVKELSLSKALTVVDRLSADVIPAGERVLVLGADTIVVLDGQILGKPATSDDAQSMLTKLSGRCHQVFTGVSVVDVASRSSKTIYQVSSVYFRVLDPLEIQYYAGTVEPMDKAGSYALQGMGSGFVKKIDGCYTNIIGLPVPDTLALLREFGIRLIGLP